jgi:hypothetical protein
VTKTKIVVFSEWPQLLVGSPEKFDVQFEFSVKETLTNTFGSHEVEDGLERYAVRVHDRNLYSDCEYCLLINQPVSLDLEKLLQSTDADHSTYIGLEREFALYKRNKIWQCKTIQAPVLPVSSLNTRLWTAPQDQCPKRVGIIFIDCWQIIADISKWIDVPQDFDFFHSIKEHLVKYHATNLVFHTGEYGSHSLARQLHSWYNQGHSIDILDLEVWKKHYQAREIYNWIVVGAHWQRCTHEKPLGFYNLVDTMRLDSRLRIFSHMDCTIKFVNNDIERPIITTCTELDYQLDTLTWKMNGRLPELVLS